MPETILDDIKAYNARIIEGAFRCNLAGCPKCGETPESFKLHEVRARPFRVVKERLVLKVDSFLCRWKCPLCNRTSIDYPPFALPYKRYVKKTVLGLSAYYVHEDTASYRQATHSDGLATFYDSAGPENIDERQLAPSTVHRWISFLSDLRRTLRDTCRLVKAKSPVSELFRRMLLPIPPWKYRSDERRKLLGSCLRLLLAEIEFRKLFNVSIFPRLATANAWG